ncbi:hypothetical protein D3C76_1702600 [compost metagenome]
MDGAVHKSGSCLSLQLGVMCGCRNVCSTFGNLLDAKRDFFHSKQIFVAALGLHFRSLRNLANGQGNLPGLCGRLLCDLFNCSRCTCDI